MERGDPRQLLRQQFDALSPGHQRVASFFLDHLDEAVFMPAARIAERASVSESTVVRLATLLGYEGFPGFQRALQQEHRREISSIGRLRSIVEDFKGHAPLWRQVLDAEAAELTKMEQALTDERFQAAVDAIARAETIYVVAGGSSAGLATAFGLDLRRLSPRTVILPGEAGPISDQLLSLSRRDLVIGITFARYSRHTLDVLRFARRVGAAALVVTDSEVGPPSRLATVSMLVPISARSHLLGLPIGAVALLNAILTACLARDPQAATKTYEHIDQVAAMLGTYELGPSTTPAGQLVDSVIDLIALNGPAGGANRPSNRRRGRRPVRSPDKDQGGEDGQRRPT